MKKNVNKYCSMFTSRHKQKKITLIMESRQAVIYKELYIYIYLKPSTQSTNQHLKLKLNCVRNDRIGTQIKV